MVSDTIAAIATPRAQGGIGIIRVSGPLSRSIALSILGRLPQARRATFATFRASDNSGIDEGIALLFPAPNSFTGEDVLELHGHGGPVVMDVLLGRCLELGARMARPGEFSERAFLNGKLDLAQAEAVADLIESSTALGARLAVRSLQGAFSRRIGSLIEGLVQLRTYLEASLDFSDEELDPLSEPSVADDLDGLIAETRRVLREAHQGERIRDGYTVSIAGPPNAGKSTLLNALVLADAAIVTPIPGTTRDLLQVDVQMDGLPVRLVDMAGLRDSQDPVEREGVRRAREQIVRSDLVLWVYDATEGLGPETPAALGLEIPLTYVRNKIDLIHPRMAAQSLDRPEILISARTGEGVEELRRHIRARAGVESLGEGAFTARRRHLEALELGLRHLNAARRVLPAGLGIELVALELAAAQRAFGEITGAFTPDDLLERIFASFCIGK